jgi:hypothetical protein
MGRRTSLKQELRRQQDTVRGGKEVRVAKQVTEVTENGISRHGVCWEVAYINADILPYPKKYTVQYLF